MKINFFEQACDQALNDRRFGICDEHLQAPAYCTIDPEKTWGAEVMNVEGFTVRFIAIDNCIEIRRPNGDMERRCDACMTYEKNIDFVELKDVARGWIEDGAAQIVATLRVFMRFHDLKQFRRKRAFVCNVQHRHFKSASLETKARLDAEFGVRIFIKHAIEL